jgi:hypothetical protein
MGDWGTPTQDVYMDDMFLQVIESKMFVETLIVTCTTVLKTSVVVFI